MNRAKPAIEILAAGHLSGTGSVPTDIARIEGSRSKLNVALIALARTIARQAAAEFLRDGASHDLCIEQGIPA
jgi:hypothetical protein